MARKIKFPLDMGNNIKVYTMEELKRNCNIEKLLGYFYDGRLSTWLSDRFLDDKVEAMQKLDKNEPNFIEHLCSILDIDVKQKYTVEQIKKMNIHNQKLYELYELYDLIEGIGVTITYSANNVQIKFVNIDSPQEFCIDYEKLTKDKRQLIKCIFFILSANYTDYTCWTHNAYGLGTCITDLRWNHNLSIDDEIKVSAIKDIVGTEDIQVGLGIITTEYIDNRIMFPKKYGGGGIIFSDTAIYYKGMSEKFIFNIKI